MADICVFCEIVAGSAPCTLVADDYGAIAIVPLNPVTEGHVIVLPREHVTDAADDPWTAGDVMVLAASLAQEHDAANIITSIGAAATQTVMHLHIHVVPRRAGDGLALPWTGQGELRRAGLLPGQDESDRAYRDMVELGRPSPEVSGG